MLKQAWGKVAQWTVFGTLGCVAICIGINYVLFRNDPSQILTKALASSALLPVVLGGPLFFFLSLKLRELAIANHRLSDLASIGSLTGCLNRGAFAKSVDSCLEVNKLPDDPVGALLVIDADHFKSINDLFGHHHGDKALMLLAGAIARSLRKNDRLGRVGGE
jgi:diguanylate cyclase